MRTLDQVIAVWQPSAGHAKPISMPAAAQRLAALAQLQVPPSPSARQQLLKGWLPWHNCKSHQAHQQASSCSKAGCLGTIASPIKPISTPAPAQRLAALARLQVPPSPSARQHLLKGWLPWHDCKSHQSHQAHQHASSFSRAGCLTMIAHLTNPSMCQLLLKGWQPCYSL
jgi:hypothetical protein